MDSFIGEVPQRDGFMGSKGDKRFGGDICGVREPVCCRSDVCDRRGCLYHSGSEFCGGWTELKGVLIESSGGQSNHPTLHLDSRKPSSPICPIPTTRSGFYCSTLSTRSTDSPKRKGWLFTGNRDLFYSIVERTDLVATWRRLLLHNDFGAARTLFELFVCADCEIWSAFRGSRTQLGWYKRLTFFRQRCEDFPHRCFLHAEVVSDCLHCGIHSLCFLFSVLVLLYPPLLCFGLRVIPRPRSSPGRGLLLRDFDAEDSPGWSDRGSDICLRRI